MRVLIFHGYLLQGTGSNVYNAELGAALVRAGHELHLLCQDRDPLALPWVDAVGEWDTGVLRVRARGTTPAAGAPAPRATVYRPDIAGLLPLYVPDRYEGIEARPFYELSEAELARYLERNVAAVREVAERVKPDVALANHLIMGPVILARALAGLDVPYAAKIHGSALEYVVKPYPRFLPYAAEGLATARGILVGSRHTAESLWAALDDPTIPPRTRLGPPGVDVDRFAPRRPEEARKALHELATRLATAAGPSAAAAPPPGLSPGGTESSAASLPPSAALSPPDEAPAELASSFVRDPREAAAALETVAPDDRLVVFVGKLIASKGVELLVAAWPLVLAAEPRARLIVVGFGAFRDGLEELAAALAAGDLAAAALTRGEDGRQLPQLAAFFAGLDGAAADAYRRAARGLGERIAWAGRLDHDEVADLLPAAEAMAVTSTFPEAFGMVAAEAAACGTFPVVADHSGLGEVARTLKSVVPEAVRPLLTFPVGPTSVHDLAAALTGWLATPEHMRTTTREAIVAVTHDRYSWAGVAQTVIAAAQGDLTDLPPPT